MTPPAWTPNDLAAMRAHLDRAYDSWMRAHGEDGAAMQRLEDALAEIGVTPPAWTKEPPREEGWYWWREKAAGDPACVWFWFHNPSLGMVSHVDWYDDEFLERVGGEWWPVPIQPPPENPS